MFETKDCTGCRTCEMACSYHHTKTFRPNVSSIEVISKPEQLGFSLSFYRDSGHGRIACDGCQGQGEPLCVKYCPVVARDELFMIVRRFKKSGDA